MESEVLFYSKNHPHHSHHQHHNHNLHNHNHNHIVERQSNCHQHYHHHQCVHQKHHNHSHENVQSQQGPETPAKIYHQHHKCEQQIPLNKLRRSPTNMSCTRSIFNFINCTMIVISMCLIGNTFACRGGSILRTGVTQAEITQILDSHNHLRSSVAQGRVPNQPSAENMQEMLWDDELSIKAQQWANQCTFQHDPSRYLDRFTMGQNLAIIWSTAPLADDDGDFPSRIQHWFNEVQKYNWGAQWSAKTGHYSQLVWGETNLVGCGFTYYKDAYKYNKLYVCNYGPGGNVIGSNPYTVGSPSCSNHGMQPSTKYSGLCSTKYSGTQSEYNPANNYISQNTYSYKTETYNQPVYDTPKQTTYTNLFTNANTNGYYNTNTNTNTNTNNNNQNNNNNQYNYNSNTNTNANNYYNEKPQQKPFQYTKPFVKTDTYKTNFNSFKSILDKVVKEVINEEVQLEQPQQQQQQYTNYQTTYQQQPAIVKTYQYQQPQLPPLQNPIKPYQFPKQTKPFQTQITTYTFQQPTNQQSTYQQPTYQQPAYQQPTYQQPAYQQQPQQSSYNTNNAFVYQQPAQQKQTVLPSTFYQQPKTPTIPNKVSAFDKNSAFVTYNWSTLFNNNYSYKN